MARKRGRKPKNKFKMPFLDRGLPGAPYLKDTKWVIQKHEPLPPFGEGYKTMHRRGPAALEQMRQEQIPQSIYCMHNQPPGPEPPAWAPKLEIRVVEELRNHLVQGSQVVGCKIINRHTNNAAQSDAQDLTERIDANTVIVAKIFDPMYYYHNGMFDIVELADMEYCREAAAYTHLQKQGVDGVWLPRYLGSYSLSIPLSDEQKEYLAEVKGPDHPLLKPAVPVRRVRLILTEKIVGESMTYQLVFGDVKGLSDDARLDAIASTLEAYAYLYHHGIVHGDLAPRNVFVLDESELEQADEDSGVVTVRERMASNCQRKKPRFYRFVDLGLAYILGGELSLHRRQAPGETRPRNPIQLFWSVFDSGAVNMYYWLPPKMRNTPVFQRWLLQRWYGDTRFETVGAVPMVAVKDKTWSMGEGEGECEGEDEDEMEEVHVDPEIARREADEEEERQQQWERQKRQHEQQQNQKQKHKERQQHRRQRGPGQETHWCHDVVAKAAGILPSMHLSSSIKSITTQRTIACPPPSRYPPTLGPASAAAAVENMGTGNDKPQGFW